MSDSFADLWASSAPTKPSPRQPQQKIGSSVPLRRQQYDAFSILSASQPSSRPVANNHLNDRQGRQPQAPSHGGDAFSDLFSLSLDGTAARQNPDRANMTMAERAVLAQKAKVVQNSVASAQIDPVSSFSSPWDGLDALARPTTPSPRPPVSTKLTSGPEPTVLWDLDEFGSSERQTSYPQPQVPSRSLTGTPSDFDFGDREDGLLADDNSDAEDTFGIRGGHSKHAEDDILGDLSKPVSHSQSPSPKPSTSTQGAIRPPRTSASPPPHIIGQLVEMGFSPVDARAALANTMDRSGFDVQAAAELLLSQVGQEGSTRLSPHPDHERRRNGDKDRDRDQRARRPPPSRTDSYTQPLNPSQTQLDITAEKLLSQASEIGRGMFSRANALWKEGKERATKIYEERATPAVLSKQTPMSTSSGSSVSQRLPQPPNEGKERAIKAYEEGAAAAVAPSTQIPTSTSSSPSMSQQLPQPPRTFTIAIALSALTTSTSYKSAGTDAYRRGDFPVAAAAYMRALSALPSEHILRVPILTNVALVRSKVGELRDTIKACEEAVVITRQFVSRTGSDGGGAGMEGMFTGTQSRFDEKKPIEVGTGKVNVLVQGDGGATSNGDLPASVDLIEGLSKAFRRRAEALEGLEKWEMARSTWEVLLCAEWAGASVKGEAVKGVGRCRKMVEGDNAGVFESQPTPPKSKPKTNSTSRPRPKPISNPPSSPPPSAALTALRSTHNAEQTEDAARLACKDAVDARLTAWKSGREGNIRALLTSLDETLLWPELGWRKVGMAEVVSKGQVKGAYVRAIARVHPDKLNAGNTTVEQRMIANGVFGALNEGWNVFQQQQQ